MPAGIETEIIDGFAHLSFPDRSLAGKAIAKLIELGGPDIVSVQTRTGPRRVYVTPEGNARAAGLLDEGAAVTEPVVETPLTTIGPAGDVSVVDTGAPLVAVDSPIVIETPTASVLAGWPLDSEPSQEWKLTELKAYASSKGIDASTERSKADVLDLLDAAGAAVSTDQAVSDLAVANDVQEGDA